MKEPIKLLVVQALPDEYTPTPLPGATVEHVYTGVGKVIGWVILCSAHNSLTETCVFWQILE